MMSGHQYWQDLLKSPNYSSIMPKEALHLDSLLRDY